VLRDLRQYAKQTNLRLFAGFVLLFVLVGEGLIWLIYGAGAAVFGFLCVLATIVPIGLIVLILWLMELALKRADHG
jgi:hypothetical protein